VSQATIAEAYGSFAALSRIGLTSRIEADVLGRILDVVGNCIAASALTDADEPHQAISRLVEYQGGRAEATPFLGSSMLPAASAALVNGTLAHALDFDDTHLPSVLHPSASVVPAALAVAESCKSSGRELLAAIAVGVEITNRVGMASYVPATRNSTFFVRGQHATSICGTLGAAAASAMLMGLDAAQISSALAIATSMGAGIIEANRTGGSVKRIHCGWAAHAGVEAASFAAAGITGPPTAFEGSFGFLRAYLGDDYDPSGLVSELGSRWELLRTVYKPYPSNHFTHPIIDCALALRATGLDVESIAAIEVGVPATVIRTIGEPRGLKVRPTSPYHAKFSAPYTAASALVGGGGLGLYLDDFTDAACEDPRRLALADKVTVVADPICDDEFPLAFSAVMTITLDDGSVLQHRTHSSRGGPEHPLSLDELETKFRLNATQVLTPEAAGDVAAKIRALRETSVVGPLLDAPIPATASVGLTI
jgi:2-methylcitrate dehydratase PrpD